MRYCSRCTYPIIAVNLSMNDEGVCSGCVVQEEKEKLDWKARENEFRELMESYRSKDEGNYDCIVPVSGGKDSHFQVWYITQVLKMKPLLVTYYTHNYTETGEANLRNISRVFGADHLIFTPSLKTIGKMNLATFKKTGDMSWHFHCGVWTTPFQVAVRYNIPLIVYGEHGFLDLAGQYSFSDRPEFTMRDRKEHYLRGYDWQDFVGMEGLTAGDLQWARFPGDAEIERTGARGVFMGVYVYWDGNKNAEEMKKFGFRENPEPYERTYRRSSNVDDIHENGIKDWLKFVKFGYGRCTDHTSKDIRLGIMTREKGMELVKRYDHVIPEKSLQHFLTMTGMSRDEFFRISDTFRDPRVWRIEKGQWWKDNVWGEASAYGEVKLPKEAWGKYEKKQR
ncbi:MAG: N-acetyl sugar amidotransferase [Candidatus Peribacteraceae bacterium]|nr:N-acetyl sugar amidotransferase [Candidatus Peribacteraceae bacterium]MDD5074797.1 N-acetyl sugar amidotransferase [Candidatus Peribacteraceae bacterium]